jgi:predicted dehydrogenase
VSRSTTGAEWTWADGQRVTDYLTALVHVFGPVRRVSATASRSHATRVSGAGPRAGTQFPVNVPTAHSALLEFIGGASAVAVFSFESHLTRAGLVEVTGTSGTLALPDPNGFGGPSRLWRERRRARRHRSRRTRPAYGRGRSFEAQ